MPTAKPVVVIRQSARDQTFIRNLARRGLSLNEINRRCMERMLWDGPMPLMEEIEAIIKDAKK